MVGPTQKRLKELLNYDPETGMFTWKVRTSNRVDMTKPAGALSGDGYTKISVDGKQYKAHRLAFLYVNGSWPEEDVDHINGDRLDNRWRNLRDVCRRVNLENRRHATAKSGLLGAYFFPHANCWKSAISLGNKTKHLGYFQSAEEAHQAYLVAKRSLHEGCTI